MLQGNSKQDGLKRQCPYLAQTTQEAAELLRRLHSDDDDGGGVPGVPAVPWPERLFKVASVAAVLSRLPRRFLSRLNSLIAVSETTDLADENGRQEQKKKQPITCD